MKDVEATPIWIQIIVICVLILGGGFFLFRGKKFTVRELSIGAISVAIAFVLSYIKVSLPQGGSVTPASMLPILAYAWAFGPVAGITAGFVYGCLQLMQGMWILHPVQVVLDYLLPFAFLGFAAFSKKNLQIGIVIACVARFLSHYVSGLIFWRMYAPEGQPVAIYSLLYNGSYMLTETIICLALSFVPQLRKLIERMKQSPVKSA
jgi:thiamine transporter